MNKTRSFAALALLVSSTVTSLTLGQTLTPAQQARQQQLKAAQAAARARAAAAGTATAAPTAAATAAPTTAPTPAATTTPPKATATSATTAAPTATASGAPPKATASAAPATSSSAAPAAHHDTTAIALDIEALRKSRPERRHAEFVDLQTRWGSLLTDPRAADELKLHAQRFAYLQRIRALGAKDPAFVKGVDALITKEETRSSDALNALRSGALPTPAPAAGASK
ncbi:MAG TPA: hypothetical protein VFK05_26870 [Polyangiaceae bacterium]|nr:hypothetical protein [Polyangiaceae bacterium]